MEIAIVRYDMLTKADLGAGIQRTTLSGCSTRAFGAYSAKVSAL